VAFARRHKRRLPADALGDRANSGNIIKHGFRGHGEAQVGIWVASWYGGQLGADGGRIGVAQRILGDFRKGEDIHLGPPFKHIAPGGNGDHDVGLAHFQQLSIIGVCHLTVAGDGEI